MRVFGKCKNCQTEIGFSTSAKTRVEFAMKNAELKTLHCQSCGATTEFHVDELFTKESKLAHLISGLIFLIGTPLMVLWLVPIFTQTHNNYIIYIVGSLVIVPISIFTIIKKQDQIRVNSFNRHKLKN